MDLGGTDFLLTDVTLLGDVSSDEGNVSNASLPFGNDDASNHRVMF